MWTECRFCCVAWSFVSAMLLFLFAEFMKVRLSALAIPAAHHKWDPDVKAKGMRNAAVAYLLLSIACLVVPTLWRLFRASPLGYAFVRFLTRCLHIAGHRFVPKQNRGFLYRKNSDLSNEDEEMDDEPLAAANANWRAHTREL